MFLKEKKWGAEFLTSKLLRERESGKGREGKGGSEKEGGGRGRRKSRRQPSKISFKKEVRH